MRWLNKIGAVSAIASSVFFIFLASPVRAIGVSPSNFDFFDLLPTTTINGSVQVSRGSIPGSGYFKTTITGTGARFIYLTTPHLAFSDTTVSVPLLFQLRPQQARPGSYAAQVHIRPIHKLSNSSPKTAADTRLISEVTVTIHFSVTTTPSFGADIRNFHLERLAGNRPDPVTVRPKVMLQNTGNIPVTIDSVRLVGANSQPIELAISVAPQITIAPYEITNFFAATTTLPANLIPPLSVSLLSGQQVVATKAGVTWPGAELPYRSYPWWKKIFLFLKK